MADKNKLKELLKQRATLPQREAVNPVNLYKANGETERPNDTTERVNRTVKTNGISERIDRTETTNGKTERLTERPNARTVKAQPSVLKEIKEGVKDDKRLTERYSFEIYTDQKKEIEDLQYSYKKKTGNKLSASRIIREALEAYLKQAISTLKS